MRAWRTYEGYLDRFLASFNRYLASRSGFAHAIALSIVWVGGAYALVTVGLPHVEEVLIFAYLAFATAFSFVTQFNVTHVADKALQKAAEAEQRAAAADDQTLEMLSRMHTADQSARDVLVALERSLVNQETMLDALIELARRDALLVGEIDQTVESLLAIGAEAREMHLDNADLIRKLVRRSDRISDAALEAGRAARRRTTADGDARTAL